MEIVQWSKAEITKSFSQIQNLKDLLSHLEEVYYDKGSVICEITVNGMKLNENDEKKFAESQVSEIDDLVIKLSEIKALITSSANSAEEYILRLKEISIEASEGFRHQVDQSTHKLFKTLIDGSGWLVDMLIHLKDVSNRQLEWTNGKEWDLSEKNFLLVVGELLEAFQKSDYILVSDILEYDWTNALDTWLRLLRDIKDTSEPKTVTTKIQDPLG